MDATANTDGETREREVGIPEIDEQHTAFFGLLQQIGTVADDLYRPLDDDGVDEVLDIMAAIRELAQDHFGIEEGYMEEVAYPDLNTHKTAHERILDGIVRLEGELLNGSSIPPVKIRAFLADSCQEHILSMDKAFGEFYNNNK